MAASFTNPRLRTFIIVTLVIALSIGVLARQRRHEQAGAKPVPLAVAAAEEESVPDSPLELVVDGEVRPARATIASLPGEEPRSVGRINDAGGVPMDLVLGEVIVSYEDPASLDAFVAAVDGDVVDRFEDEGESVRDALVRFDAIAGDRADVAARMTELEPDLAGDWEVSEEGVLDVFEAVAIAHDLGLVAMPNTLHEPTGILDGATSDGGHVDYGTDAFNYPYVQAGTAQDIGLDRAWRLLADTDNLDTVVRIMVHDQGFSLNQDSPDARWIEDAVWGQPAPLSFGPTRFHGALVANAAMGKVDNGFGGAGPAGPTFAQLVAVGDAGSSWSTIRRLVDLVDEYRPHVLNMSWSAAKTTTRLAHQDFFERKFRKIKDMGTLPFASAGNDSRNIDWKACGGCIERRLVLPCEAKQVVCVGGMGEDTTARAVGGCGTAAGSNYGTRTGGRSVEIWGPYFVSAQRTTSGNPGTLCGTSFASPFVAGVAGLLHAADPDLSPDGIWNILKETANSGGIGGEVTGHQRRIDAAAAVERALGGIFLPPRLEITSPSNGDEFGLGDFISFEATALDHLGRTLEVTWESDRDGVLGTSTFAWGSETLSEGSHTITATVSDNLGDSATESITITLENQPTHIKIHSPTPGEETWLGQAIFLAGSAEDGDLIGHSVPDEDLHWTIVSQSNPRQSLFAATGSSVQVPKNTLAPGLYVARLWTTVDGYAARAQISFSVKVPPSGAIPDAVIDEPTDQQAFGYSSGDGRVIHFEGHAVDAEDGALPGTRLRWTARHEDDDGNVTETVLCRGSSVPDEEDQAPGEPDAWIDGNADTQPAPQFQTIVDCSSFDAELGRNGEIPAAQWVITLEAFDTSGGPTGTDKAVIEVGPAIG